MSVRLNIVLSQSRGKTPTAQEVESDLVLRLIGTAAMDLTLIGPLEQIDQGSTDRLVLESIGGDVAVLCWHSADRATRLLNAAGIVGRRAAHPLDPMPPQMPSAASPAAADPVMARERRLYLIDMQGKTAGQLVTALEGLLASRRTVTYSLLPSAPAPVVHRTSANSSAGQREPATEAPAATVTGSTGDASPRPLPMRQDPAERSPQRDPWDALVDDLNASDI